MTAAAEWGERRWRLAIAAILLAYCAVETAYVLRLPLVMDEFDGAYEAYRLRHDVPYRDYAPYKTVAGYAIEAVPAMLARSVWSRIITIKLGLVLINAAMFGAAALLLRDLPRGAIAGALALLVANSNFLERSAELRVDMLTAWAGMLSLLFLLRDRYAIAGALCAVSFLVSQKGALYVVAANAAIAAVWLLVDRTASRFRAAIVFNAAAAAILAAYVTVWAFIASWNAVIRPTFLAAAGQAMLAVYDIRAHFWTQTLVRNPVYLALSVVAIVLLAMRRNRAPLLIAVYAAVLLVEAVTYKQPWPYFFPLIWPTLFVTQAMFFAEFRMPRWAMITIAIGAVAYPLLRVPVALSRDNAYQHYNVNLASTALEPDDTYIAGTDILHDHEQSVPRLARLDGFQLELLRQVPAAGLQAILGALERRPPKLLIATYRLYGMPRPLLEDFLKNYARVSASIFLYAPSIDPGPTERVLWFSGRYRIDSKAADIVTIDGRPHRSGEDLNLGSGFHNIEASQPLRLRYLPERVEAALDPQFVDERPFYVNVYDY